LAVVSISWSPTSIGRGPVSSTSTGARGAVWSGSIAGIAGRRIVASASATIGVGVTAGRLRVASASTGAAVGTTAGRRVVASRSAPAASGSTAGRRWVTSRSAGAAPAATGTALVTGKIAEQTLQRARTPASGTLAGSTR
jgi:hypothetical protein